MNERGVVLLEVLIAVTIVSTVGIASIAFLVTAQDSYERLTSRETEMQAAERVLTATTLLTRSELEQRIGVREVADFVVSVDRPEPSLFRLGVAPAARPAAEVLSTLVYRPLEIGR